MALSVCKTPHIDRRYRNWASVAKIATPFLRTFSSAWLVLGSLLYSNAVFGQTPQTSSAFAVSAQSTQSTSTQPPSPGFKPRLRDLEAPIPNLTDYSQCKSQEQTFGTVAESTNFLEELPESSDVQLAADSMPLNTKSWVKLLGNVSIRSQKSLILADELTLDKTNKKLSATGRVSFESSDAFVSASSLTKDETENLIELLGAQFYLFDNNANGQAQSIGVKNETSLELNELTFSTCPIDDRGWELKTERMAIDQSEGTGEAWDTTLEVRGVPVFYFPYIAFPIDDRRKSGLLTPGIKTSNENGLDFKVPFYWNIAPQMDATITPRFIENRGKQLGTKYRLLTEMTYSELNLEWMGKDKRLQAQLDDPLSVDELDTNSSKRWFGQFENQTKFNKHWRADLTANRTSDSNYFRDFSSGLESSNSTRLTSQFDLSYSDEIWQMDWFAVSHQSLIGRDYYRYLPSWTTEADYLTEAGWRLQFESEITRFENTDSLQIQGDRAVVMPSVSYPMHAIWGYLTPKLSYQVARFEQEDLIGDTSETISRSLPIFSLDSALYFDRRFDWDGKTYTHTLEPRLFYTYIPFREQSAINVFDTRANDFSFDELWRPNRFTGVDRVGDANQLSLAFGNRVISDESGEELLSFSIGQRYYFSDREVSLLNDGAATRSQSPLLLQTQYQVAQGVSIFTELEYDADTSDTLRAYSGIKFEPIDNHIVNLTHRYRDRTGLNNVVQTSEEIDFSFAWPINDRWRLLGRWYNDINRKQTVEALAGFEYASCCWSVRLVAQRYLNSSLNAQGLPLASDSDEYNNGIYLQFVFNGLGSAGQSGVSRLLTTSIVGYEDTLDY